MKKTAVTLFLTLLASSLYAQDINDALRYSMNNLTGTARFNAMGGAFGAIGGDFSSINVNPAGSAFIENNQVAVSVSSFNINNESNYFGTSNKKRDNTFDMNQLGAFWILNNIEENSNWGKIALGINYENTNNFENSTYTSGFNPNNSVDQYFISHANGLPLNSFAGKDFTSLNFQQQQAYMGYEGYLINEGLNNNYVPSTETLGNYYQSNYTSATGYNGKLSFNIATEYDERFYFGLNLNAHFSDYANFTSFYEDRFDATNNNENSGVQALRFENSLRTFGSGFSFQLGGIAKVTNDLQVGVSYESPTWYQFDEEITQNLVIDCPDCGSQPNIFQVTPNATMIFAPYKLQTPSKFTSSLSYKIGKNAVIGLDYSMKDYSNMSFKPKNEFTQTNSNIDNLLTTTGELRIGGEYNIKNLSLRAGYRFEESPYKNNQIGNLNSYSTGLGYNFGEIKADIAYTFNKRNYDNTFFSQGLTDVSYLKSTQNNITVTVLFEL